MSSTAPSSRRGRHSENETWSDHTSPANRLTAHFGFGIVLLVLLLAPLLAGGEEPWARGLLAGLVILAGLVWATHLSTNFETQVAYSYLIPPVLVLMTYGVVRYTLTPVEVVARPEMIGILTAGLIFLLMVNLLRRRWQHTALVWIIAGLGVVLTLHAFAQVLGLAGAKRSGHATFPTPADLAVYLQTVFAVAAAQCLFSRRHLNERVALAFVALFAVAGWLFSGATHYFGGWLAAAAVLGLYLLRRRGWRFRWLLAGAAVFLLVGVASWLAITRLGEPVWQSPATTESAAAPAVLDMLPRVLRLAQSHG